MNWQQFLTERVLGECWHEPAGTIYHPCLCSCGKEFNEDGFDILTSHISITNRTFDNPEDFFVLWNWAKKQEWWEEFLGWIYMDLLDLVDYKLFPELLLQFGKERLGWK